MATITVDLRALTGAFVTDLGRAEKAAKGAFKGIESDAARMGVALGAGLASLATGLAALAKQAINTADTLANMSQKVGVSVESLSTLGYAAKQSDVELQQLQSGLVKLAKNASDAAQGVGTAGDAFAALGVEVKNADGSLKDTDDLLRELAGQFAKYEDGANKTALAVQIFGRAGAELIPLLNEGADGIAQLEERARTLGLEISTNTAQQAEAFNDLLEDMGNLAKGFGNDLAASLLPYLSQLTEEFVEGTIATRDATSAAEAMAEVFKALATAVTLVKNGIEALATTAAAFQDSAFALGEFLADTNTVTIALRAMNGQVKPVSESVNQLTGRLSAAGDALQSGLFDAFQDGVRAVQAFVAPTQAAAEEIVNTEQAALRAAPAIVNLAKAEADAAKQAKEAEDAARAYAQMIARAMNEEQDYYARQRKEQEDQARRFDERARDLEQEISLLGLSRAERERLAIAIDAENMARDQNGTVVEAQRQRYEDLLTTLQQAQKIEAAAREFESIWLDAVDSVADALADGLIDGFDDGADGIMEAAKNLLKDLTRYFLQQSIVVPLQARMTGATGAFPGFGNMMNGQYAGTNTAFGSSVFGDSAGQWFGGNSGWGAAGNYAAAAGGIYGVYDTWRNGPGGTDGALQGAASGAAAGTAIFPGIGTAIGAVVGLLAGYFGGGDPVIRVSDRESDASGRSRLDDVIGVARDRMGEGAATAVLDAIVALDNSIASITDSYEGGAEQLERIRGEMADWAMRFEGDATDIENILTERFGDILGTFSADVQAFVNEADSLEERLQRLAQVLVWPDQINALLEGFRREEMLAGMTEIERQTYLVNEQFDALVEQLTAMQATEAQLAELEEHRASALARLTGAQVENTEAIEEALQSYAEYIDQFGAEFRQGSAFQQSLQDLRRELAANIETANELARAAGLSGAREEDLLAIRQHTERETQALIAGLTETVISQIAELYGTTAEEFERQIAAIDAEIAAMDRSDSTFGMVQNLMREAQLGAERERLVQEAEAQAAALEALQRQSGALDLAQNLADLSIARGVSFEQLASEFGLSIERFGADLGVNTDAVDDLIRSLAVESLTGDDYFDGVQRIVDAINGAEEKPEDRYLIPDSGPGPKMLREFDVEPIRREEVFAELVEENRLLRADVNRLLQRIGDNTGASVTEQRETNRSLRGSALDAQRNTPPNVRVRPKARA